MIRSKKEKISSFTILCCFNNQIKFLESYETLLGLYQNSLSKMSRSQLVVLMGKGMGDKPNSNPLCRTHILAKHLLEIPAFKLKDAANISQGIIVIPNLNFAAILIDFECFDNSQQICLIVEDFLR